MARQVNKQSRLLFIQTDQKIILPKGKKPMIIVSETIKENQETIARGIVLSTSYSDHKSHIIVEMTGNRPHPLIARQKEVTFMFRSQDLANNSESKNPVFHGTIKHIGADIPFPLHTPSLKWSLEKSKTFEYSTKGDSLSRQIIKLKRKTDDDGFDFKPKTKPKLK